jgi:hypothetical protein
MELEKAIQYVRSYSSDPIESIRLDYLLNKQVPSNEQIKELITSQREDGSWSPFWAPGQSSLDATCYRLAILEQVGIKNHYVISKAIDFLSNCMNESGVFEEDKKLANVCPPWVQPGDIKSQLYLTSNCGFWINYYSLKGVSSKPIKYLSSQLGNEGEINSFLHTYWLVGGLFYSIGMQTEAYLIFNNLIRRLSEMSADNLAWLLNTLIASGVPKDEVIIKQAIRKLLTLQHDDGGWTSDDGSWRNVHTTLEAKRAINLVRETL